MIATAIEEPTMLTGIQFVSAYVDDFEKAYDFYANLLGLKKAYDMGDHACFFELGPDQGLYLQGENKINRSEPITAHASFTFGVPSAIALFDKLKKADVQTVEEQPIKMGEGLYWFRFYDTAGNLLEALGGE